MCPGSRAKWRCLLNSRTYKALPNNDALTGPPGLLVTVSVADLTPVGPVVLKVTLTVQLAPSINVPPQVVAVTENCPALGPENDALGAVAGSPVLFCMVNT